MSEIFGLEYEQRFDQFFIHFDVTAHHIKLETFIQTARHAQEVVNALDTAFFSSDLKYELVVVPPEEGTFLTKLGIYVVGGAASLLTFMNTDIGKAYIDGLTGHEPAHWAKEIGESHRKFYTPIDVRVDELDEKEAKIELQETIDCRLSSKIVAEMTRGILEKDSDVLNRIGVSADQLPEIIEARNEFFGSCISDRDVQAIGFTRDDDFSVPRSKFSERAARIPRREEKYEIPWEVGIETIFVTSPNWDKEDQAVRKWKGKDSVRRDCYFVIEDEKFWLHAKQKDLPVDVLDKLKVQWAFQNVDGKMKNRKVLRVLEFNDDVLSKPIEADALLSILGSMSKTEDDAGQGSLLF